jgi:hypothetical protein
MTDVGKEMTITGLDELRVAPADRRPCRGQRRTSNR